jgi:hypothetical protein
MVNRHASSAGRRRREFGRDLDGDLDGPGGEW